MIRARGLALDLTGVPPYLVAQQTPVAQGDLWLSPGLDSADLGAGGAPTAGQLYLVPWFLSRAAILNAMAVNATATATSNTPGGLGIYASDPRTLYPTKLLARSNSVALRNQGLRSSGFSGGPIGLTPGLYWAAVGAQGVPVNPTLTLVKPSQLTPLLGFGSFGAAPAGRVGWKIADANLGLVNPFTGMDPLPAGAALLLSTDNTIPLIMGRFSL